MCEKKPCKAETEKGCPQYKRKKCKEPEQAQYQNMRNLKKGMCCRKPGQTGSRQDIHNRKGESNVARTSTAQKYKKFAKVNKQSRRKVMVNNQFPN